MVTKQLLNGYNFFNTLQILHNKKMLCLNKAQQLFYSSSFFILKIARSIPDRNLGLLITTIFIYVPPFSVMYYIIFTKKDLVTFPNAPQVQFPNQYAEKHCLL